VRIGRKPLVESDVVPSIIGTSFLAFTEAVAKVHGRDVVEAARARMSDDERQEMDAVTAITWLRATTMTAWVAALAEAAGVTKHALVEECARLATHDSFKTVWRMLLRFTSAEALIARTPLIYSRTRNIGRMEVASMSPGKAKLVLTGWPGVHEGQLHSLAVSIKAILELSGRRSPACRFECTEDGGLFEIRWGGET
jgi:hypothetical protein